MPELKPCPFCGNIPELTVDNICDELNYQVSCTHCFARTYLETSEEEAVEQWNRRADDEWY